ncbi:Uncharacterised protein [Achromobacter ruhlandii]|nr:Uncharacterised protein [Achromobacter ruhlandii]
MPLWSSVKVPYWPLPSVPSSLTAPVAAPLMVGASLVPLMVMVTCPVVPSAVVTVKVSVRCSLAPSCWTALASLSSLKVQLPLASIENVPYLPAKSVCGWKVAWPASLSVTSSLPLAV